MSGGVPAGEGHDADCGLLYEDGPEHCTCKLLPCPFCGSEARYEIYRDAAHVLCGNDDCEADVGPWYANDGGKGLAKAIERWNTRATPTPPIKGRDADVEQAIAEAIDKADAAFGYSFNLTRLVDGEATHTLTMPGFEPVDFEDRDEGYALIAERRNALRAAAIRAALQALGERG